MSNRFKVNESACTVLDTTTNLEWQREVPDQRMTWAGAKAYAAALALDGGGWRLPSVEELFALADRSRCDPAIDVQAFPNCPAWWFWSATPWVGGGSAWLVDFSLGSSVYDDSTNTYRVRCVR